jgi:hypothetical protein
MRPDCLKYDNCSIPIRLCDDDCKEDCRWLNDVECPYATGYQECDDCDTYEKDEMGHPLDDGDRGDYLYEQMKDRKMMEEEE